MHMKKTFLLLLLVSTLLFSCSKSDFAYDDWNKIEISDCGSIEIPDKRSWADRVAEAVLFDRDGGVYKSRFGSRVKAAVIIGLLILLLLLRLAILGYHPSFR